MAWRDEFVAERKLSGGYAENVRPYVRKVAERILHTHSQSGRPVIVGVSGAQGSGSTALRRRFREPVLIEEFPEHGAGNRGVGVQEPMPPAGQVHHPAIWYQFGRAGALLPEVVFGVEHQQRDLQRRHSFP